MIASLDPEIQKSIIGRPDTPPPPPHATGAPEGKGAVPSPTAKGGSGWWWGISAGAGLVIVGIIFGFQAAGSYCGAPFKASNLADYMDAYAPAYGYSTDYAADCQVDMVSATATTWILIGLGVLVTLASALIMATIRSGSRGRTVEALPVVQTVASRIEDLARLRDKGLVSPEEYEWKRQELLRS